MHVRALTIISVLAVSSDAVPLRGSHEHLHAHRQLSALPSVPSLAPQSPPAAQASAGPRAGAGAGRGGDTFQIAVTNNCPDEKQFAIYEVTASFDMNQVTSPVSIASGGQASIAAPYHGIGMRLSATAGDGAAAQWNAQALFEFGYSEYAGQDGTAYDISLMSGSDPSVGISVMPDNPMCPSKKCTPSACSQGQGWTSPDQVNAGSPADTVCYHGKTNFRVVWCP